jgi:hypothetical protein
MLAPFFFQRIPGQHNLCFVKVLQAATVDHEQIAIISNKSEFSN